MAVLCSMRRGIIRATELESAAFGLRLNAALRKHLYARPERGRGRYFCTLIMRSSRGLALYKILNPRIEDNFFEFDSLTVRVTFTKVRDIA